VVLAALMAALMLLSGGIGLWWGISRDRNTVSSTSQQVRIGPSPGGGGTAGRSVADAVEPAVVDITTYVQPHPLGGGTGDGGALVPEGAGTGMMLSSTGEVLTNNHVIKGASSIEVTISGRSGSYAANVVGADPTDDVALLQIQGVSGLPTVTLADSSALRVGQQVVAIGNAFGRGGTPTVTNGTVSALHRTITVGEQGGGASERLADLIQTDAPIRPGDSGGPLVDSSGKVIGMITAGARGSLDRAAPNIGYAIPVNGALGIVNQIRAGNASATIILGHVGYIGVQVANLDGTTAARLKVSSGALVVGVEAGGPAAGAGISSGAAITAIDGHTVGSADALGPLIHAHGPGDKIQVTWVDVNGTHTATMTLVLGPAV
jgi:S1-C subfamily serine protease